MASGDWESIFREGEELMKQGRRKEAAEKFRDAARAKGMDLGSDLDKELNLHISKLKS